MMRRVEERDEMRADVRVQCAAAIESRGMRERRTWREREMEMGMERREEKECKSERTAHEHETTKEKQGKGRGKKAAFFIRCSHSLCLSLSFRFGPHFPFHSSYILTFSLSRRSRRRQPTTAFPLSSLLWSCSFISFFHFVLLFALSLASLSLSCNQLTLALGHGDSTACYPM